MADKDKGRSTLGTLLAFTILIGLLIWAALIFSSQGEERLEQACKPVEYTTQLLHEFVTSIIGRQPTWTLYTQQYLMNGCYYGFSVFLSNTRRDESITGGSMAAPSEPVTGGIKP